MSNIPSSERRLTKIDFFDKAIDLRKKVVEYIDCDFGIRKRYCEDGNPNPRYWIYAHIREDIYKATQVGGVLSNETKARCSRITGKSQEWIIFTTNYS